MQSVRIIEIPDCKVVSSSIGMFGDDNFTKFEAFISSLPNTMYSKDFLFEDNGGLHWVYMYDEWMDVPDGLSVIDFTGGLCAVTTDIDQQTDIDAMDKELHEFLCNNGFEQDKSRPRMGNVITPATANSILGYNQMDYFMPIKPKEGK
jgi:AraC family transcriptional regulator